MSDELVKKAKADYLSIMEGVDIGMT